MDWQTVKSNALALTYVLVSILALFGLAYLLLGGPDYESRLGSRIEASIRNHASAVDSLALLYGATNLDSMRTQVGRFTIDYQRAIERFPRIIFSAWPEDIMERPDGIYARFDEYRVSFELRCDEIMQHYAPEALFQRYVVVADLDSVSRIHVFTSEPLGPDEVELSERLGPLVYGTCVHVTIP